MRTRRGRLRRSLLGVSLVGAALWAGSAVQIGPLAPEGGAKNPQCGDDAVENPNGENWYTAYKFDYNPLMSVATGGTRVMNEANPRITITKRDMFSFDWTSSMPISAVVVKASNTANIYLYSPAALSGGTVRSIDNRYISSISWCVDPDIGGTTTTTRAPTTTSTTRPPTTTTSTTRPPTTTTSTPGTLPPE
jgi:hypothetical protein